MSLYRFGDFTLDPDDRVLRRGDAVVDVNARYLDALYLLVRDAGRLVTKDRFMDEVWRGVPVTDEALTQCIKTLRRQLGDAAGRPRFIETVPKYGYRFIAAVDTGAASVPAEPAAEPGADSLRALVLLGGAGTIGAGMAGLIGGLFYGFVGAAQPLQPGLGAVSVLLVLTSLTILAALIGGAGVSFGIAAARFAPRDSWWPTTCGGALGGMLVGAFAKLLGLDAFNLLIGQSPGNITGGGEGVLLGGAVGLGVWLGRRPAGRQALRRAVLAGAAAGGLAGVAIPLLGGTLMGGSLNLLARSVPSSRLRLDHLGALFGESQFGPVAQVATGAMEGMLFGGCIAGAMYLALQGMGAVESRPLAKSMAS